ncbi:MAG TPA: rhodanese-like domain-containing protein, partial [Isosphaeraceae bacterium]|nr:rhodanese-like domain-containing protein [Isosphaeraceae bacterium]
MMTIRWTAVLMMFANAAWTWAAEPARPVPQPPPLLSHDALEKRQKDPTLRLLDARPKADYDKGHIPGALWVDLKALQALANSETIVDQDAWSTALAPLGIGPDMEVYLYDADRQHDAGRVWWLLSYAGVE